MILLVMLFATAYQRQHNSGHGLRIRAYAYRQSNQWHGKDALGRDVAFERVGNDLYVNGSWYGRVVEEK